MHWILLSLLSALFLGWYDVAKKAAVHNNAVPPVLLLNVMTAAMLWLPLALVSHFRPDTLESTPFQVVAIGWTAHLLLLTKSCLVAVSWTCAFFALKHLPISIATPIRATSPLWTVLVAVTVWGERPSINQWVGMLIILLAFLAFSRVGKTEGIHFHRDPWIGCMLAATLLGSLSALYDKFLLQTVGLSPATVQCWFSIYLVPAMLPLWFRWLWLERRQKPFQWRWSIPAIAVMLLVADFLYFSAVSHPEALISIISPVRRTSIVIPFMVGIFWLAEHNWRPKAACIAAMLLGVYLLSPSK